MISAARWSCSCVSSLRAIDVPRFLARGIEWIARSVAVVPIILFAHPACAQSAADAIGSILFQNVLYAQAALKVSTPLIKLTGVEVATGGNHLAVVGADGGLRLWNLQLGSQQAIVTGKAFRVVAPSGDGAFLLLGQDSGDIALIDARSGGDLGALKGGNGAISAITSSITSDLVVSGTKQGSVMAWDVAERRTLWQVELHDTVQRISMAASGQIAAATSAGKVFLIDGAKGHTEPTGIDFKNQILDLRLTAKGEVAAISTSGEAALGTKTVELGDIAAASIGETGRRAVIARKDGAVVLVDLANGKKIRAIAEEFDDLVGVVFDESAAKAIVVLAGGQFQVFDTETAEQVLSVFVSANGWAMVDRQGRFDGNGASLRGISWSVKKLNYPITSLAQAFADPGLLSAILEKSSRQLRDVPGDVADRFPVPPKVEIEPIGAEKIGGKPFQLLVVAEDQGGGIKDVRLYHNGKIVDVGAVLEQKDATGEGKHVRVIGYNVWPVPGSNVFQAIATGAYDNESEPVEYRDTFAGDPVRGRLYLISVGISRYQNLPPQFRLQVAAEDAKLVKASLNQHATQLFDAVESVELIDGQATKTAMMKHLGALRSAKPEDAVVLFLSGHGFADESDWYFLPADARADSSSSWISATEIRQALEHSGAQRVFVIIDSCYSGGTVENFYAVSGFQKRFLTNGLRNSGIQVLTATRRDQLAPESAELGSGFLTYVVNQAIVGAGDIDPRDGLISSQEVAKFAYQQVPQIFLAQRQKNPKAFREAYGAELQEPAVFSLGSNIVLAKTK